MKFKRNVSWIFTFLVFTMSFSFSSGACFVSVDFADGAYVRGVHTNITGNPRCMADYKKRKIKNYKTKSCTRGKNALKKYLKDQAKEICRNSGSPRRDLLRKAHFPGEITCDKFERDGDKWVRVEAELWAVCR